jgi:hypothetical protein
MVAFRHVEREELWGGKHVPLRQCLIARQEADAAATAQGSTMAPWNWKRQDNQSSRSEGHDELPNTSMPSPLAVRPEKPRHLYDAWRFPVLVTVNYGGSLISASEAWQPWAGSLLGAPCRRPLAAEGNGRSRRTLAAQGRAPSRPRCTCGRKPHRWFNDRIRITRWEDTG